LLTRKQKYFIVYSETIKGGVKIKPEEKFLILIKELCEKQDTIAKTLQEPLLHEFSLSELHCLDAIGNLEHPNVTNIALTMNMTRGAISKITKRLKARKLLSTYSLENNRKEVLFTLTEKGRHIFDEHRKGHIAWEKQVLSFLQAYPIENLSKIVKFLALVNTVRELANMDEVTAYDRTTQQGILRHLVVRTGFASRHVMLVFVVNDPSVKETILSWVPALEETALDAGYTLKSVWMNLQTSRDNRILSDDYRFLFGEETIEEEINGVRYKISPDSFFQVNPVQTEKLFREVVKAANTKPGDSVLDLYCGVGAIALQLASDIASHAQGSGEVIGVEIVEAAVDNARDNAKFNGIENVHFIKAEASKWLHEQKDKLMIDVIVVDPPRKGLDHTALDVIRNANCERLIYVSCNPATLVRDLDLLSDRYQIVAIQPVDMFPRTMHVESCVLLSKIDAGKHIKVEIEMDELDLTASESKATYPQIKEYVLNKFGLKVSSLYIAQVKRECGIEVGENYNKPKKDNARVPQCPPEKREAIMDALRYFKML
jgi:23S rRNA (uracil1939-C5)-methyltransferase